MKLHVLAASVVALLLSAGVATAQTQPAPAARPAAARPAAAAPAAALPVVDKTHASYALGWNLGQELRVGAEPIDIATVVRGLQDAFGNKQPAYTEDQLRTAYSGYQQRMEAKAQAAFRKALDDNKAQSTAFLAQYKAQQGVVTMPNGIMYRIAKPGTGAKPTANSEVQIAFRSFLAAVGTPLSGVQTPPPFKVSQAPIPAIRDTLPLMQQGSVWEVVIPPGAGLGTGQNAEFAQQAIALQIELGAVK